MLNGKFDTFSRCLNSVIKTSYAEVLSQQSVLKTIEIQEILNVSLLWICQCINVSPLTMSFELPGSSVIDSLNKVKCRNMKHLNKLWLFKSSNQDGIYIFENTVVTNFCSPRCGSLLLGLRTLDPPLGPPSTWAEISRHMCLQSHLQTSPPTPQKSYPKFRNPRTTFENNPLFR